MKRQLAVILFMGLFAAFVFSSMFIIGGCGGDGDRAYLAPAPSINTAGGDGGRDTGAGGGGGRIDIVKYGGTGPTEVLRSGTVATSYTPTPAAPILGANPLSIATSTTITVEVVEPPAGTPYLVQTDTLLRISNGNAILGDEPAVTGLSVAAGATLTLELNSGGTAAEIDFSNDVANNGTITTDDVDPSQRGSLYLDFFSYYGASGSRIRTSGTVAGQNGGDIELYTAGFATAGFFNRGAINAAGADNAGGNGGNGGYVEIGGYDPVENSGAITTAGGDGGAGDGGDGGPVWMVSGISYLYNSGAINSTGGNGTGSGGWGGLVALDSAIISFFMGNASGELRNSGAVRSSGGNGAGGPGGPGAYIELAAFGADLLNNAALNSAGGDTSEATSAGGAGGDIWIASLPDIILGPGDNLLLAGNIDSSGGNALATGSGNGGTGGSVEIVLDASGWYWGVTDAWVPTTQRLALFSCDSIDTSGGSGNQGGSGGYVYVNNLGEEWDAVAVDWVDASGGDTTNQAAITTRGGSVAAGASATPALGGSGGSVYLYADQDGAVTNPAAERVTNSGRIDTSGGQSRALTAVPANNAGGIDLYTTNDVTNTGALTANGGSDADNDDTLGTGFGHGGPGWFYLEAIIATATNSGAINANGGDGEDTGGDGAGFVFLGDDQVVNSANISVRGGDADVLLAGSFGGDGGDIVMNDVDVPDNTGTLDVSGGAGDTPGSDGTIIP